MSKNLELQEEFEALIKELERLKSINEITSENSNSAKKTIDEIESFVKSINVFKTSIEKDYNSKKKDLEAIENSLTESLATFNSQIENQTKKFETLQSNYAIEFSQTLDSIQCKLDEKIHSYTSEVISLKEQLQKDIKEYIQLNSKQIEDQTTHLIKTVTDNQKEISELFQFLNDDIASNSTKIKNLTIFIISTVVLGAICFGYLLYKFI
jgi:DNA repair exonuclease SbcCD ATPase subunit